jgi:hypothetical protein
MRVNDLTDIVGSVAALSIATERLVEITKGFIPFLNQKDLPPEQESKRRSLLQILAITNIGSICGCDCCIFSERLTS